MRTGKSISVSITTSALHQWPGAPDGRHYLRYPHMHNFRILVSSSVSHSDRQIEFHDLRDELTVLVKTYILFQDEHNVATFGDCSCEMIGERILELLPHIDTVTVSEDESVAATVTRIPEGVKPQVVTICGSTKFKEETLKIMETLTLEGHMVFSVGLFGHADGIEYGVGMKEALDRLHFDKIRASDWIYVVNVDGYTGYSTNKEIELARDLDMPIVYLVDPGG